MDRVAAAVEKLNNKDVTLEFERIQKALKETGQISSEVRDFCRFFMQCLFYPHSRIAL